MSGARRTHQHGARELRELTDRDTDDRFRSRRLIPVHPVVEVRLPGCIPDLHGSIGAGRCQKATIGAECSSGHPAAVSSEREQFRAGGLVPDFHRPVHALPSQSIAVGTVGDAECPSTGLTEAEGFLSGPGLPDPLNSCDIFRPNV
jgi:hypothetical protein